LNELLKMLESDPSEWVREKAAQGVGRFAYLAELGRLPQRWIDRVHETLFAQASNERNPVEVQRRIVEGLGYFNNNEQVTKIIEKAYQSDSELLKGAALRAMGRNMNPRWLPEIGKEMSNPDPLLRFEAATAVGEMSSQELLPALIPLIEDKDHEVQMAAIWSLGQVGGPLAKRELQGLLKVEGSAVREAAQEALKELAYADDPINPLSGEL
jgi:HEAT repeat protein